MTDPYFGLPLLLQTETRHGWLWAYSTHPANGHDLVMVVSADGHGLFDAATGEKTARDRDPDPETSTPDVRLRGRTTIQISASRGEDGA